METTIRTLKSYDYKAVKDIFYDAFEGPDYADKNCEDSWRDRSVPDSYGIFSGGKLLGFAIVSFHKKNGTNRYLDYLAIHSAFRGQDLGSKLLTYILDICREKRESIHLYPVPSPRIKAWYKSHGFYETTDGYMNQHFYQTRLSQQKKNQGTDPKK